MTLTISAPYTIPAGQTLNINDSPGIIFYHPFPYDNVASLTIAGTVNVAPPANAPFATGLGGSPGAGPPDRGFIWIQPGAAFNVIATATTRAFGLNDTGINWTDFINDGVFNVSALSETTGIYVDDDGFVFKNTGTFQIASANSDSLGYFDLNGGSFTNNGNYLISGYAGSAGVVFGGFDFSFTNTGTFSVTDTVPGSIGVESWHLDSLEAVFTNSGTMSADIAFITLDYYYSPPGQPIDIINNSGTIHGFILTGLGNDEIHNTGQIFDSVYLEEHDDLYDGTAGHEYGGIDGGPGNDTLRGGIDGDFLLGSEGNDTVDGGGGADLLAGDSGNDVITGGAGDDVLIGGHGRDNFTYASVSDVGEDVIADFDPTADRIDLSAIAGLAFIGTSPFSGLAGQMRYTSGNGETVLTIDSDGNGSPDAALLIEGEFALTETSPGSRIFGQASSDFMPPFVIYMSPFDNTQGEPIDGVIVLKFLEPVIAGTGTIDIYKPIDTVFASIPVTDTTQVTFSGNTVTINPTGNFAPQQYYYVAIAPDVITDLSGNGFAGITGELDQTYGTLPYDFTTGSAPPPPDTTPPHVYDMSPRFGVVSLVNVTMTITFDENIKLGSGNFEIRDQFTGALFATIDVNDTSQVTVSGNKVIIDPASNFAPNKTYYLYCNSGIVQDLAGNNFGGMGHAGQATSLVVTTVNSTDTTSPVLLGFTPADNATGVPVNSNIVLTFDEPVRAGSGSIHIRGPYSFSDTQIFPNDQQVTYSGNTVTINPLSDLQPGGYYYVTLTPYSFLDIAGNPFGGMSSDTAFNFTTLDSTPPSLTGSTPSDNASNVTPTTDVALVFSEAVKPVSGNIEIHNGDGSLFVSYAIGDTAHVTFSGTYFTVNPDTNFGLNSSYYVLLAPGVVADLFDNPFAGITSPTSLNFTTAAIADQTPPSLSDISPWYSADTAVDANILFVFSEPVAAGSGAIVIDSAGHVQTITVTDSSQVSVVGNTLTINPKFDLDVSTVVHVTMGSGVILDLSGNAYPGLAPYAPYSFVTTAPHETVPPVLLSTWPVDNATNVPTHSTITLTFNEPVKAGPGHIQIYNQDGTLFETLGGDETIFGGVSNTVTLQPHSGLAPAHQYYVTVDSNAVQDYSGNSFAGISSPATLNFSTAGKKDKIAPTFISSLPSDDITFSSPIDRLRLSFSERVIAGTGNIEIRRIADGSVFESVSVTDTSRVHWISGTVYVDLPITLPLTSEGYYIFILPGVFTDPSGNSFAGLTFPSVDNFFLGPPLPPDTTAPTYVNTTPPKQELGNLSLHQPLRLNFSEGLVAGSGNIEIHHSSDGSLFESFATNDSAHIGYIGASVEFHNPGFEPQTSYYVLIDPGALKDSSGNIFAGISSPAAITFTTAPGLLSTDTTRPNLSSTSPSDNATNVPANSYLVLTFSEAVMPGAGGIEIHNGDGSVFACIGVADTSQVSFAGNTVTINPAVDLNSGAYYVSLVAGVIQDKSGNIFSGITSATVLNFSTGASANSDFDANSHSDILWQNTNGPVSIWTMDGFTPLGGSLVGPNPGPAWHAKSAGDFNGDGKADILWQHDNGQVSIWLIDGFTALGGSLVGNNTDPAWQVKDTGDFNSDGKADILWQNADGRASIWLMDGLTPLGGGLVGSNYDPAWKVKGSGDFNGDGKSDILWQHDSGPVSIWLMDGLTPLGGSVVGPNPGTSWHIRGTGDFNADGKSDILWQHDNGQASIWLMDGLTPLGGGLVGNNYDPAWQVKGTGDFNGDGMADILWQNTNGQVSIWTMNGLTPLAGSLVGPNPGSSWSVVANLH